MCSSFLFLYFWCIPRPIIRNPKIRSGSHDVAHWSCFERGRLCWITGMCPCQLHECGSDQGDDQGDLAQLRNLAQQLVLLLRMRTLCHLGDKLATGLGAPRSSRNTPDPTRSPTPASSSSAGVFFFLVKGVPFHIVNVHNIHSFTFHH